EAVEEPKTPLRIPEEAMPDAAKLWMVMQLQKIAKANERTEDYRITDNQIELVSDDDRRIPWVWDAQANLTVMQRSENPKMAGMRLSMLWHVRFVLRPDTTGGECWREVTEMATGQTTRHVFEISEWTRAFREEVNAK